MTARPPVDVVLLSYERTAYLAQMLDALEAHTRHPFRVTVVDNASSPAHRQWLRDHAQRFERIVWNARNEHLAGFQRGIEATASELLVLSDADIVVHPPGADGRCWLTRLVELAERHPDFGLISARLDRVTAARNAHLADAPVVDGELIEAPTGVWLNLLRRPALRVPYRSDGITGYALRRAGHRVGVARDVLVTHLGDDEAHEHPDYLARKNAATRLGVTYPRYGELAAARRPPTPLELALAAPALAALAERGIEPADVVELSRAPFPPLRAVRPEVEAAVLLDGRRPVADATRVWRRGEPPPLLPAAAAAVAVVGASADEELLGCAQALAARHVVVVTPAPAPVLAPGWRIADERPGPADALVAWAEVASRRRRLRAQLGHATDEHRDAWLALWRDACFGAPRLRAYLLEREAPAAPAVDRWRPGSHAPAPARWARPLRRRGLLSGPATKAARLLRTELDLLSMRRPAGRA